MSWLADRIWLLVVALAIVAVRIVLPVLNGEDAARVGPHLPLAHEDAGSPAPRTLTDRRIYLVPLDGTPSARLQRAATRLSKRFDLEISLLPRMRSEIGDFDRDREQLVADSLLLRLESTYPAARKPFTVIGITDGDLYLRQESDWRFAFGMKDERGYGAISTARMDPANLGAARDDALLEQRLGKMTMRYIGEIYLGLPRNANPASVLGSPIGGLEELDRMSEELCPARPGERVSC